MGRNISFGIKEEGQKIELEARNHGILHDSRPFYALFTTAQNGDMDIELHVDGLFGRGSLRMSVMYDWPIGEQFGIVRKEGRLQKLRLEPKLQLRVEPADMEPFSIVSNGNGKVEAIEAKLKNALGSRDRDMMKEALADALDLAEEKVLSMTSKDRPLYDALVGMAEYSNLGYSTPIMTNYMESMTRNVMDKCRGVLRH